MTSGGTNLGLGNKQKQHDGLDDLFGGGNNNNMNDVWNRNKQEDLNDPLAFL